MRHPINPFAVPGSSRSRPRVLDPRTNSDHAGLYSAVCGSAEAFERFCVEFDSGDTAERGGMVVVLGDTGFGKTALLNRCVAQVMNDLRPTYDRVTYLDLERICPPTDSALVVERIAQVGAELFHQLRLHHLDDVTRESLTETATAQDHQFALRRLNERLHEDVALLVRLPSPGDVYEELWRYAFSLRTPRVVYVAETSGLQKSDYLSLMDRIATEGTPTVLELREIHPDEIAGFLAERLSWASSRGIFPKMDDSCATYLASGCESIRRVEALSYQAYQRRLNKMDRYTETDTVSWEDLSGGTG